MGNRARIRQDAMSLNPIDDALFQKMAEDRGFCQEILQSRGIDSRRFPM